MLIDKNPCLLLTWKRTLNLWLRPFRITGVLVGAVPSACDVEWPLRFPASRDFLIVIPHTEQEMLRPWSVRCRTFFVHEMQSVTTCGACQLTGLMKDSYCCLPACCDINTVNKENISCKCRGQQYMWLAWIFIKKVERFFRKLFFFNKK